MFLEARNTGRQGSAGLGGSARGLLASAAEERCSSHLVSLNEVMR